MHGKMATLADDVLAAFERACKEGDLQAAEHLLQALETLDRREQVEGWMERIYFDLALILRKEVQR